MNDSQMLEKMFNWIKHPAEFGKKPDSIELFDKRELYFPNNSNEMCYLYKFHVDGIMYIGFCNSCTTWCFFGIDFTKLTIDELYLRYIGWYIDFFNPNKYKSFPNKILKSSIYKLNKEGYTDIKLLDSMCVVGVDNLYYYIFQCKKDDKPCKLVGLVGVDMKVYENGSILPFYEFIGLDWNPFDFGNDLTK